MKAKIFLFVIVGIALLSCGRETGLRIRVHVDDDAMRGLPLALTTQDTIYQMTLDSTSSAVILLPGNFKPTYGKLLVGNLSRLLYVRVFLEPGGELQLSADSQGKWTFSGSRVKENQFLNNDSLFTVPDYKLDEAEFIAALDEEWGKVERRLEEQGFDARFTEMERNRLKYAVYLGLPSYGMYHGWTIGNTGYLPGDAFYQKLQNVFTEDETLMGVDVYMNYMKYMLSFIASRDESDPGKQIEAQLKFVEQNFKNPLILEYMVDYLIYDLVKKGGAAYIEKWTPVYDQYVKNADMRARFEALCNSVLKVGKGQPSPSFAYQDINGKVVKLSDLAGKYVYIDCWATWCGPCRQEQPFLEKLEKKYAGRNIYFVSISCDTDKSLWEKMVKDENLGGIQLHAGGDRTFMDAYMITGIPRFILLDREGKILDPDMSRPSDPETTEVLDALEGL